MVRNALGTGVYGTRLAAKLAGVSRRQLRYWVSKGLLRPSIHRARRGGRDLYSYEDLVQARVIGRLRGKHSLQAIGRAIDYLRTAIESDHEWHTKTLVADQQGIFSLVDGVEVVNTIHESPGQVAMAVFLGDVADELVRAGDILHLGRELEVNIAVQGGSPVIKGTRIPTKLIGELINEGVQPERIVTMYPGISPAAIEAATEFETQLAAV